MIGADAETRPYGRVVLDEEGQLVAFHVLPVVWLAGGAYTRHEDGTFSPVKPVGADIEANGFTWRPLKVCLTWGG